MTPQDSIASADRQAARKEISQVDDTPNRSAFPGYAEINGREVIGHDGMSVREYFAGQALAGLCAPNRNSHATIVKQAVEIADALIAKLKEPSPRE